MESSVAMATDRTNSSGLQSWRVHILCKSERISSLFVSVYEITRCMLAGEQNELKIILERGIKALTKTKTLQHAMTTSSVHGQGIAGKRYGSRNG